MSTHTFPFSQSTFGGHLACTAVATLSACGFAETQCSHNSFKTYCRAGSQVWQTISTQTISVDDILQHFPFFKETYEIESFQCCVQESDKEDTKYIPLQSLLALVQAKSQSVGMVFTDGTSSFSVGKTGSSKWWAFDSHTQATLFQGTLSELIDYLQDTLQRSPVVDCTTFVLPLNEDI